MTNPLEPITDASPNAAGSSAQMIARGRSRFVRNTLFSVGQQGVSMVVSLLLVPYMLWQLSPERFGLWVTLQIFSISGLVSLAELGFQGAIVRYLVKHLADRNVEGFRRLLVTSFALFLAIGTLCGIAIALFGFLLLLKSFAIPVDQHAEFLAAFYVYAAALVYGFPALTLKSFLSATQNYAVLKIWETIERLLTASAITIALLFSKSILLIVILEQGIGFALFVSFVVFSRVKYREYFSINPRYATRRSLDGVLSMSGLMFLNSSSLVIYLKLPDLVIGHILGPTALAYYSIVTRIPRALKAVQGSLNAAVTPFAAMLDSIKDGIDARRALALRSMRFSFMVFVPIVIGIVVFAEEILTVWLGGRYAFLADNLRIIMVWQLTAFIVSFASTTFTRSEHYSRVVWKGLLVNVLFVGALMWVTGRYGVTGALVVLLLSGVSTMLINLSAIQHANDFSLRDFYASVVRGPILLSSLISIVVMGTIKLAELHSTGLVALMVAVTLLPVYVGILHRYLPDATERRVLGSWKRVIGERLGQAGA